MGEYDYRMTCSEPWVEQSIKEYMTWRLWRVNALLVLNAMLMGVMVGIGAYAPRYRHHPLTRFIFRGATALFMPIVSYVVSVTNWAYVIPDDDLGFIVVTKCTKRFHRSAVLQWITFIQIVAISTTVVVATNARELGRSIAPSALLLADAIWTCYLVVYTMGTYFGESKEFTLHGIQDYLNGQPELCLLVSAIGLIFVKLACKFCAYFMAGQSFALGRNPQLIVRYMCHLHAETRTSHDEHVPPLLVMGEDTVDVDKRPHGYSFRYCMPNQSRHSDDESPTRELIRLNNSTHVPSNNSDNNNLPAGGLVSLDKVWKRIDERKQDFTRPEHLKDVCLSFALFKLLRCRFARYKDDEVKFIKVENFFCQKFLPHDHTTTTDDGAIRLLKVISDELSFLHDYYYSSLPVFYSKSWLLVLSISTSLFAVICQCILESIKIAWRIFKVLIIQRKRHPTCQLHCPDGSVGRYTRWYGNFVFDQAACILLVVIVVLVEARDIAFYVCSNWTKVTLICRYMVTNHLKWQTSPVMRRCVGLLLQCSCKLVDKAWKDKMNLCSVLQPIHIPRNASICHRLIRRFIPLPEKKISVNVPGAVKTAIISKLRSSERRLSNGTASLQTVDALQVIKDSLLQACSGEGTADVLLAWHIATTIVEVRHPTTASSSSDTDSDSSNSNRVVATHLSGYCAYLVAYCPELLPDDEAWTNDLYKAVTGETWCALAAGDAPELPLLPEEEYTKLVELLGKNCKHEVVKNGTTLAEQLEELGEEKAWEVLAGFWSEMILYVAPSDNLDGHAAAVARGGELITQLWALLTHAGIITRPSTANATAAAAAADNENASAV